MKNLLFFISVLFLLTSCSNSVSVEPQIESHQNDKITGNFEKDIKILVPEGSFIVDVLDAVSVNPRFQELQTKFMQAVEQNKDWFIEQQQIIQKTGKDLEYHPNIGLTKDEYEEMKYITKNAAGMEMMVSENEDVNFFYIGDTLKFQSLNKLDALNYFSINIKEKKAWFDITELTNFQEINIENENNGLRSKWKGYKWSFSNTDTQGSLALKSTEKANVSLYSITLGQLEKDNSTYMEVTVKDIVDGEIIQSIQIPFRF